MPTTMLFTMIVAFALSISVAVAIGIASLIGAWQAEPELPGRGQGDVRRAEQVSAGGDPVLHPRRQPDGIGRHLGAAGGVCQVHRRRHPGRAGRHLRAHLHDLRRGVRLQRGHHLRHRRHPDPGADQARLPHQLCGRAAGHLGRAGGDHPAVDPDDPVRRVGRGLDRRAVHRRRRPGPADRRGADGLRHRLRALEGLRQGRPRRPAALLRGHAQGGAGAADAGDHPWRHLRRRVHAHRGLGGGGVLRADRRRGRVPRDQDLRPAACAAQERGLVGGDHVHHRQRRAVQLPDHARRRAQPDRRGAGRMAAVAGDLPAGREPGAVPDRHVHRDLGLDHRAGADPGAGGPALRHRPGALRHRSWSSTWRWA